MTKKHYMLAFGDSRSHRVYSFTFTKVKIFFLSILFSGLFFILAYLTAQGLDLLKTDYRLLSMEKENAILKSALAALNEKTLEIEQTLNILAKKNKQMHIAAALPIPDAQYGTGGPDFMKSAHNIDIPELKYTMANLNQLEEDTEKLHQSMNELERHISVRFTQIAHYPSIRPVRGGWISSVFGNRTDPFTGISERHPGIDISVRPGTEICATAAGIVNKVNNKVIPNKGYGKYIIIDHGYGYKTLYGHMSKIYVRPGQKVKRWDIIGLSGNTGKSTAPHIHYGIYAEGSAKNPMDFILE
jgi:murein DD-endopeptidase MepM/ murein hydrolase activator NlpD